MNSLAQRVINILKAPKAEWPVIAAEPATVGSLYTRYALILAAIGPVALLLGGPMFGFGIVRLGYGFWVQAALQSYVVSLVAVAVLAFVVNALAASFGGTKDTVQAFKTCIYAMTASWIAGIGNLIPALGWLIALAGAVYSIYLLYLALPHTMKVPPERAAGYTVVIVVVMIVLTLVLGAVLGGIMGTRMALMGGMGTAATHRAEAPVFEPDSALGRLEQAGREMERAEKEGRTKDPAQAVAAVMGAFGGAQGAPAEALSTDRLQAFVPETFAGLPRRSISAERNGMFGVQVANARASYGEGERQMDLEITDTGGAAALMALAGWAQIEQSSEEGSRRERTGREGSRMVHEVWDSADGHGEYSVVLGERFVVKAQGSAGSLDELKAAVAQVDLAGLEALRGEGVRPAQ